MRWILISAGAAACLALGACGDDAAEPAAEVTAPEPERRSLARSAPRYAGVEIVQSVQSGTVAPADDGGVLLTATATTAGPGWTDLAFLPRIYAGSPDDGVYEVDVIGAKPPAGGSTDPTTVEVKGAWSRYTDGRVKGIRFMSETNDVLAMLPATAAPAEK